MLPSSRVPQASEIVCIIDTQFQTKLKIERARVLLVAALQRVHDVTNACAAANDHALDAIFDAEASLEDSRAFLRNHFGVDHDPEKPAPNIVQGIERNFPHNSDLVDTVLEAVSMEAEGILEAISMESQSHGHGLEK